MTLEQLTEKVTHLEREISKLRREITKLSRQKAAVAPHLPAQPPIGFPRAEKTALKKAMVEVFEMYSIKGEPIGAKALRELMREENLAENELSRGIIEARDE